MKKIISVLIPILILVFTLTAFATDSDLKMVEDFAKILTKEQTTELNTLANAVSETYKCDVRIITVPYMDATDAMKFAEDVYITYNLGYGEEKSGVLLFLSMAKRDYALIAYGYGNTAFTDYGKDQLLDKKILPKLANNDYYGAFRTYILESKDYLSSAQSGHPIDSLIQNGAADSPNYFSKLLVTIIAPLLIAGLICFHWVKTMNPAVVAKIADDYIPKAGFLLTQKEDTFLYRTESRRKRTRETNSSSSGRHSKGTTINSRGFSGRSGKF